MNSVSSLTIQLAVVHRMPSFFKNKLHLCLLLHIPFNLTWKSSSVRKKTHTNFSLIYSLICSQTYSFHKAIFPYILIIKFKTSLVINCIAYFLNLFGCCIPHLTLWIFRGLRVLYHIFMFQGKEMWIKNNYYSSAWPEKYPFFQNGAYKQTLN